MKISCFKRIAAFLFLLAGIQFSPAFAQSGCYVRDGDKELYSSPTGGVTNLCGSNAKLYSINSKVARDPGCNWTPTFPSAKYNCMVVPGDYCGIQGSYTLECPIDSSLWYAVVIIGAMGAVLLRKNAMKHIGH